MTPAADRNPRTDGSRSAARTRLPDVDTKEPFEQVVARHGPTVLRVCRAVLGAGPDADDAWSETFLAALQAWPDLPADTHMQAWLVRVAQRKAIDVTRSRSRQAVPTAEQPEHASPLGIPQPDRVDVWRAVQDLPPRQRLAIAYHYLGGLPHTETAELIGSTPDAVRRAAADGIKNLRATGLAPSADFRTGSALAGRDGEPSHPGQPRKESRHDHR